MPQSARVPDVADQPTSAWRRVLVLLCVVAIIAGLASSDALYGIVLRAVDTVEPIIEANPRWGISLFILLSALSAMLAFFSTAIIAPIAVRTWGEPLSIGFLWIGWMIGGMCAYTIGRTLGRPVVRSLISGAALDRFESRITTRAPFSLVLLFQLALPSEVPGYILGLARYRLVKYLLILSIAELPFAVGTVYLGTSLLERRMQLILAIGAIGVLFSAWALSALQKRLSGDRGGIRP